MKRIVKLLFVAMIGLLFVTPVARVAAEDNWSKIESSGKLVVGLEGTYYPSAYYSNDNKDYVGYEIDLLKEIAKRLNLELEFQQMQVDGLLTSIESGQIDIVANGFSITPEREEKYLFSTPTMYTFGSIIVRSDDDSGIHSLEDFKGKKAAGGATTVFMKIAEKYGAEPVVYDNVAGEVYMRDVETGRTDFIPNDYYVQSIFVGLFPDFKVKVGNVFYNPSQNGYVLNKEAVTLKEKIDAELQKLREEGFVSEVSKKYWGDDVSVEKEEIGGMKLSELPVVDYAR